MWLTSVSGPANQSTEDAETLNLLWKPNLEIYGLQVVMVMVMVMVMVILHIFERSSRSTIYWAKWLA